MNKILYLPMEDVTYVQGAVRAHNFYKELKKGCNLKLINDWSPNFSIDIKNITNWSKLIRFGNRTNSQQKILVENILNIYQIKIFKYLGFRFIVDIRDDLNLHADSMKIEISDALRHSRNLATSLNFKHADKILVPSESLIDYFLENYKDANREKFICIPNASDPEYFHKKSMPKIPTIGMVAGLNHGQGFDIFLEASRIVKKQIPNLKVKCAFNYLPETKYLKGELLKEYNEDWIEFREDVFYSKNAPDFYSSLSICVIPRRNTIINQVATPSKLFDSMAAARPLVVTNLKEQRIIVEGANCGLVSDFSPEDISKKIVTLFKNQKRLEKMGNNGRNAVEIKNSWNKRAKAILEKIF